MPEIIKRRKSPQKVLRLKILQRIVTECPDCEKVHVKRAYMRITVNILIDKHIVWKTGVSRKANRYLVKLNIWP